MAKVLWLPAAFLLVTGCTAYAPTAPVAGYGYPAVVVPAPDPLVRSTQIELIRLNFLHDVADGYMGPKTRNAIAGFEQANGLPVDASPSMHLLATLQSTSAGVTLAPAALAAPVNAPAPSEPLPSQPWVAPANTAPAPAPAPTTSAGWVSPPK